MERLVRARYVLAHDDRGHHLLEDAFVALDAGRIAAVGTGSGPAADEVVDLGQTVLLPGLIDLDALVDIDHLILDAHHEPAHARELAGSLDYWQHRSRDILNREQRDTLRRFGLAQLALHGITTYMPIASEVHLAWGESPEELRALADLTHAWGLRGFLGPSYRSAVGAVEDGQRTFAVDRERGRAEFAAALEFADELAARESELLTPVLLPCRIETLDPELMEATAEAAAERDLLVRLHSLQQPWEREVILERHGITPLDLLERTGLLNDRLLIPHALWTDRNPSLAGAEGVDLERLARSGASVIHCPLTTFRYGDVLSTFADFRAAGITMALGTDSFPPDLLRGMDVGFYAARNRFGHGTVTLADYLDAATTGGARALKRPDLGRIEVGAAGDLSAFSLTDFRDGVVEDPLRTLILNGSARNATHTFVAGRPVVRDGALPGVDLEELRAEAQEVFGLLIEGYRERDARQRETTELFPPVYPVRDGGMTSEGEGRP